MAVSSTRGRRVRRKEKKGLFAHLKNLGFTNRLALYIMVFLAAGLAGGFYLAVKSAYMLDCSFHTDWDCV